MIRIRRTYTKTETVERLLAVTGRVGTAEHCTSCRPGTGWLTVASAAEITGWPTRSLVEFAAQGKVHSRPGPDGVPLICAISLSLRILKGDEENET